MRHVWGGKAKSPRVLLPHERIVEQEGLWRLLRAFLEHSAIRGYSVATTDGRRRELALFIKWAHRHDVVDWPAVDRKLIESYQRALFYGEAKGKDRPLSTRSQVQRLTALQAMFRFLVKQGHIDANPAADLELPKASKQLPKHALTADEAERVMLVPDVTHPMGVRLRAVLEVFYSTGLRRQELVRLAVADVDFGHGTVHVRQGKGNKDRFVPIGERALLWVKKYFIEVRPLFVDDVSEQTLFVTNSGKPFSTARMSELVTGAVDAADVGKKGSCHLLRHTMATLMLEGGADIRYVQAMLGHALLSTTEIYTHVAIGKLKEVHERTHPAKLERCDDVEITTP